MKPVPHTYLKMLKQKSFSRTIAVVFALHITVLFCDRIPAYAASPPADELKSTITILAKARDRLLSRYREPLGQGTPQGSEQQDLLVFISYLDGRIHYYCEQLSAIDGASGLPDTACPAIRSGGVITRYMTIPDTSSRTSEERLAELDSSFTESLGTFDEMLLKEQQSISAQTKKQREEGRQAGALPGEDAGVDNNQAASAGAPEARGRSATTAPAGNGTAAGIGAQQQQIPPAIGTRDLSQSDDDIIAKQLKEAAEQETDPETQAKLWEEYRKYREGTR